MVDALGHRYRCTPFPWPRAQSLVKSGSYDGLFTYPTAQRREYMLFTPIPAFEQDWGYLVYNKDNPRMRAIAQASNFDQLRRFTFLSIIGSGWQNDVMPPEIERMSVPNVETQFKLMFARNLAGFAVMTRETAIYFARQAGHDTHLGFVRATFLPGHMVPFHIGLRRSLADADRLIADITRVLASDAFIARSAAITAPYQASGGEAGHD